MGQLSEIYLRSHFAAVFVPPRRSVLVFGGSRYFTGEYFHDLLELKLPSEGRRGQNDWLVTNSGPEREEGWSGSRSQGGSASGAWSGAPAAGGTFSSGSSSGSGRFPPRTMRHTGPRTWGSALPEGLPPWYDPPEQAVDADRRSRLTRGLRGRLRGMLRDELLDEAHYRDILTRF